MIELDVDEAVDDLMALLAEFRGRSKPTGPAPIVSLAPSGALKTEQTCQKIIDTLPNGRLLYCDKPAGRSSYCQQHHAEVWRITKHKGSSWTTPRNEAA